MTKTKRRKKIVLLRHADALSRRRWEDDDMLRPLSKTGARQAEALGKVINAADVTLILSSPSLRCVSTVEPLARRCSCGIEETSYLLEGMDPNEALDLVLARTDGEAPSIVVACSHGDVLVGIAIALEESGMTIVGANGDFAKAARMELDVVSGEIVAARYEPPPL